jgi:hypothetical protein
MACGSGPGARTKSFGSQIARGDSTIDPEKPEQDILKGFHGG